MRHTLHFLATILAVLFASEASAGPIDSNQALRNAQTFLQEKGVALQAQGMRHAQSKNTTSEKQAPYYVFNIGEDKGFVIASGDDRTPAVLGYSDKGSMDLDSLPENVKYWLGTYEEQIKNLDKTGAKSGKALAKRVATSRTPVGPLLTCKWGQCIPYFNNCPIEPSTNRRSVTGCVATAMAQVMYYHRKNSTRQVMADIPPYTLSERKIEVQGVEKGAPIDWDNMLDEYDSYSCNYNYAQEQAVANLMYYCGSSVEMNYSPVSSNGDDKKIPSALVTYFDYDDDVKWEKRENYTNAEWETMVYDELDKGNPIVYAGGQHAYVLDGYDDNGYVHVNWGWDYGGGYYLLSVSTAPSDEDIDGYGHDQRAIFGARPNGGFPRLTNKELSLTGNTIVNNLSSQASIPVSLSMTVSNLTDEQNSFDQAIGLYKNGQLQTIVKELPSISDMAVSATQKQTVSLELESTLSQGVYTLVPLSKASGAEKWRKNGNYDKFITVVIYGGNAKLVVGTPEVEGDIITFACKETKRICVENWDANGDGELSKEEAAAVTSLDNAFRSNKKVTSFDELKYFTGLSSIGESDFYDCRKLSSIVIPENVETIEGSAFYNCYLDKITIPKNIRKIDNSSIKGADEILVEEGNQTYDSRNNCNAIIETESNTLVIGCYRTVIPEGVKVIGDYSFYDCGFTAIALPESVTSIGVGAFMNCRNLSSITMPKGVTVIDEQAFWQCVSLRSVTLNQGLMKIETNAFNGSGLESVFIPASVESISGQAFNNCANLVSIKVDAFNPYFDSRDNCNGIMDTETNTLVIGCQTTTIPQSAVAIGDYAFYNCGLKSIDIPSNVKIIGDYAFASCDYLQQVVIPEGVTELDDNAFEFCRNLTTVTLPSTLSSIGSNVFKYSSIYTVVVKGACPIEISEKVFTHRDEANLYVPVGSTENYRNATYWKDFKNIVEGDLPQRDLIDFADLRAKKICVKYWDTDKDGELSKEEAAAVSDLGTNFGSNYIESFDELQYFTGLTTIPDEAFYYNSGLKSIKLPPTIKSIGNSAFARCKVLEGIVVPEGVVSIGDKAFSAYSGAEASYSESTMSSVSLPSTLESIGENAFEYCHIKTVNIPESVTSIGVGAFENCELLTTVNIPKGVKKLEDYTFRFCQSLKTITLQEGLQSIGTRVFRGCPELNVINMPESLISIDKEAFYESGITSLYIPKNVSSIGIGIAYYCSKLAEIKVDPKNTIFDSRDNCNGIIETTSNELVLGCQNTVIPNTVTSMSGYAFENCVALKSLKIPASVSEIGFPGGCDNLISIQVDADNPEYCSPDNCNAILSKNGKTLLFGCQTTVIPNSVEEIGGGAFSETNLKSLVVPEGVTGIGGYAFSDCVNLISIDLPESLESLGEGAFQNCTSLTSIHLPSKLNLIYGNTFLYCSSLKDIIIPENIVGIGNAFQYCSSLKSVSIPSAMEDISDQAFRYCDNLEAVVVKVSEPLPITYATFTNYTGATLYVPQGCRDAYKSAENWCQFGEIRELTGIKGDVNQDGEVSVYDVTKLIDVVLGKKGQTIPLEFTDLNGDGEASIYDVTELIDIILKEQ